MGGVGLGPHAFGWHPMLPKGRSITEYKQKLLDPCFLQHSLFWPYFSSTIMSFSSKHKSSRTDLLTYSLLSPSYFPPSDWGKKWATWGLKRPRRSKNQKHCPDRDFKHLSCEALTIFFPFYPLWITLHVVIINDISLIKRQCDSLRLLDKLTPQLRNATARQLQKIAAFEVAWRVGKLLLALTSKGFVSCNPKKSRHEEEGNFLIAWVAFFSQWVVWPQENIHWKKEVRYYRTVQSGPQQRTDTPSGWCQEIKTASCPVGDE